MGIRNFKVVMEMCSEMNKVIRKVWVWMLGFLRQPLRAGAGGPLVGGGS